MRRAIGAKPESRLESAGHSARVMSRTRIWTDSGWELMAAGNGRLDSGSPEDVRKEERNLPSTRPVQNKAGMSFRINRRSLAGLIRRPICRGWGGRASVGAHGHAPYRAKMGDFRTKLECPLESTIRCFRALLEGQFAALSGGRGEGVWQYAPTRRTRAG
jgi:hypothetical protein